ncbi:hypothetical protein FE257_010100 [Aspergillus nanangensis]|uniref:Zn(2)-C6 fungal-type domain-containing protein n=1 Tax=Aspergillus nanangensis TaxID=2582783 RepID=A0AAD4CKZ2_ASPNN|nr:hypothetical protein FE257_010100 [Aspergillus nanangensis]
MPRPKVPFDKRQRTAEACTFCQTSKKRCSATLPCTNCVRRGRGQFCTLQKQSTASPEQRLPHEQLSPQSKVSMDPAHPIPYPAAASSPEATHRMQPRMLRGSHGQKVFIGPSASLSFLQFIRDTVSRHLGPSQFSNNEHTETMFEDTSRQMPSSPGVEDMDLDEKERLVDVYLHATSGMIEVISRQEAIELLDQPLKLDDANPNCKEIITQLIIAIAQCSQPTALGERHTRLSFASMKLTTLEPLIQSPNLEMVVVFLLMSFSMLGACRRNLAYMYLGVATRGAVVLGLHCREAYMSTNIPESRRKARVWMSLRVLDSVVSTILARPSGLAGLALDQLDDVMTSLYWQDGDEDANLLASYRLAAIMDRVVNKVYSRKSVSTDIAEDLLRQLRQWTELFPGFYRIPTESTKDQQSTEAISRVVISTMFHFTVTLVTRPFLITTLTAHMTQIGRRVPGETLLSQDPVHVQLASACTDSAIWLLHACLEAKEAGLLLDYMFVTQALVFAAALILGFSLFVQREINLETEAMFSAARDILRSFSAHSPQAGCYHEILTHLSQTISHQRQQTALQSCRRSSSYFDQVVPRDTVQGGAQVNVLQINTPPQYLDDDWSSPSRNNVSDIDSWLLQNQPIIDPSFEQGYGEGDGIMGDMRLAGWDSLDLSLWDSFPFPE